MRNGILALFQMTFFKKKIDICSDGRTRVILRFSPHNLSAPGWEQGVEISKRNHGPSSFRVSGVGTQRSSLTTTNRSSFPGGILTGGGPSTSFDVSSIPINTKVLPPPPKPGRYNLPTTEHLSFLPKIKYQKYASCIIESCIIIKQFLS